VDAALCSLQTGTQESQASRSRSLRVRLGVVVTVAIVIEYYVPRKFQKQSGRWIPPEQRGEIIPFPVLEKKSVLRRFRLAWPQLLISARQQAQVYFRFHGRGCLEIV
jgi:hypothetical protein